MKDLNQLLLKFDLKQNYQYEDFYVSKSNFYAFNLINRWPKWEKNIFPHCCRAFQGQTLKIRVYRRKFQRMPLVFYYTLKCLLYNQIFTVTI